MKICLHNLGRYNTVLIYKKKSYTISPTEIKIHYLWITEVEVDVTTTYITMVLAITKQVKLELPLPLYGMKIYKYEVAVWL